MEKSTKIKIFTKGYQLHDFYKDNCNQLTSIEISIEKYKKLCKLRKEFEKYQSKLRELYYGHL